MAIYLALHIVEYTAKLNKNKINSSWWYIACAEHWCRMEMCVQNGWKYKERHNKMCINEKNGDLVHTNECARYTLQFEIVSHV